MLLLLPFFIAAALFLMLLLLLQQLIFLLFCMNPLFAPLLAVNFIFILRVSDSLSRTLPSCDAALARSSRIHLQSPSRTSLCDIIFNNNSSSSISSSISTTTTTTTTAITTITTIITIIITITITVTATNLTSITAMITINISPIITSSLSQPPPAEAAAAAASAAVTVIVTLPFNSVYFTRHARRHTSYVTRAHSGTLMLRRYATASVCLAVLYGA
jgi:hypothetical protein